MITLERLDKIFSENTSDYRSWSGLPCWVIREACNYLLAGNRDLPFTKEMARVSHVLACDECQELYGKKLRDAGLLGLDPVSDIYENSGFKPLEIPPRPTVQPAES